MLYISNHAITQPFQTFQIVQVQLKSSTSTCPLTKSIYQAIAKPEFEIRFSRSKTQIATDIAALTIKHKTRGNIASYNMGGSMGYGSLNLGLITSPPKENTEESENKGIQLKPVFFDRNWQNVNGTLEFAPQYLFIGNLGVEDWYSSREGSRSKPLGEVMWKFARCQ